MWKTVKIGFGNVLYLEEIIKSMTFQKISLKDSKAAIQILRMIGFSDQKKIEKYLEKTQRIYGRYISKNKTIWKRGKLISSRTIKEYTLEFCYEHLLLEVNLKAKKQNIEQKIIDNDKFITATDLASFNFCPASYSVSKSFNIIHFTNQIKTEIGNSFHEKLKLINQKNYKDFEKNGFLHEKVFNNEKINKIKKCKLIFSGHDGNDKYFINQKFKYVGQPDYIFQDPNGDYFVVEEKFQLMNSFNTIQPETKEFHSNHVVQLQSYIKFITDFDIKYGVLIYWFYNFNFYDSETGTGSESEEGVIINDVSLKIIKKEDSFQLLKKTYVDINQLQNQKRINFINDINPYKCAACVVNKYCSHKTDKFDVIELPYNLNCLQIDKL